MRHAFIADGRLYLRDMDGGIREIESRFACEKAEKAERLSERHGWKGEANPANPLFGGNVVWGSQAQPAQFRPFRFEALLSGPPGEIYYLVGNGSTSGFFRYGIDTDEERMLFIRPGFVEAGIDRCPETGRFVLGIPREDGRSDIELYSAAGRHEKTLSGGDSRDTNPTFSRKHPKTVLYQSSGISRAENGIPRGSGPEEILRLDLDTGAVETVLADSERDFLLPREDADGNVYAIRRPYRPPGEISLGKTLWDCITFPFRLLSAIIGFLDVFTKLFSQRSPKPGGPAIPPPEGAERYVKVLGKTIDLARVRKRGTPEEEWSLAPGTWELIRQAPDGAVTALSPKVVAYDLAPDGSVHITNGFQVRRCPTGPAEKLFRYRLIQALRVLGPRQARGMEAASP